MTYKLGETVQVNHKGKWLTGKVVMIRVMDVVEYKVSCVLDGTNRRRKYFMESSMRKLPT